MPVSKNALIRYKTIDKCLRNHRRYQPCPGPTLEDLIEACSDALEEFEGRDEYVSRRTVQLDIQMMRSDKLGYNAPIKVVGRKYYVYDDPDYSLTESPLSAQDVEKMGEAVKVLRQLSGFQEFAGMEGLVSELEDLVHTTRSSTDPVIFFDKNDQLKGLELIEPLHAAILGSKPLTVSYQSFKAQRPRAFVFFPYALKEFNNRWFLFGKEDGRYIMNLALDRIASIGEAPGAVFQRDHAFDPKTWFADMVGVTKSPSDKPQKVVFRAAKENAPYIRTKPFHPSQRIIEEREDGSAVFELKIIINNELVRLLLGYAEGIKVMEPRSLAATMKAHFQKALEGYSPAVV